MKSAARCRSTLLVALGLAAVAADAAESSSVAVPARAGPPVHDAQFGTIQLFNGHNLDGLQVYSKDPEEPAKAWTVSDGILHGRGTPLGYIRTQMAYADYRLHLEWRWPSGAGNSGVMLHIVNRDEIWPKSFEANLQVGRVGDLNSFWDARDKEETLVRSTTRFATGTLARPAAQSVEKPLGEWNSFDIVVAGDTITLTANGIEINRMTGVSPSAGMIGLQSEGGAVDFRNWTLTPLSAVKELHALPVR